MNDEIDYKLLNVLARLKSNSFAIRSFAGLEIGQIKFQLNRGDFALSCR